MKKYDFLFVVACLSISLSAPTPPGGDEKTRRSEQHTPPTALPPGGDEDQQEIQLSQIPRLFRNFAITPPGFIQGPLPESDDESE